MINFFLFITFLFYFNNKKALTFTLRMELFNYSTHIVLAIMKIKEFNFDVRSFTLLTHHNHSYVILSK